MFKGEKSYLGGDSDTRPSKLTQFFNQNLKKRCKKSKQREQTGKKKKPLQLILKLVQD